jgi:hypothetical protein
MTDSKKKNRRASFLSYRVREGRPGRGLLAADGQHEEGVPGDQGGLLVGEDRDEHVAQDGQLEDAPVEKKKEADV